LSRSDSNICLNICLIGALQVLPFIAFRNSRYRKARMFYENPQ
jgi:hypothetical protein